MLKPIVRPLCALRRAVPVVYRYPVVRYATTVRFQPVRFKSRFFTSKRALAGTIYTGAALTWIHLVLGPTIDDSEEEDELEDEGVGEDEGTGWDDEEISDKDTPLFIPLGWPKPLPRRLYRDVDPECKEYKKLDADPQRKERMCHMLVELVHHHITRSPAVRRLGQLDAIQVRSWLQVVFPHGPPQEYERAGIEVGDDYIAWTKRPVDQVNYQRLRQTLWPAAVASGALAGAQYLYYVQMNRMRESIGLRRREDPAIDALARHVEVMQREKQQSSNRPAMPPGMSMSQLPSATARSNVNTVDKTAAMEKQSKLSGFEPIPPQSIAMSIFSTTFLKNWKAAPIEAPRGTIIVTGLIEILADKAKMFLDVTGVYDPLQDQYVLVSMRPRFVQDRQWTPRGKLDETEGKD